MSRTIHIQNIIRDAVEAVTGITNYSNDASLIDRELAIIPAKFLYIFEIIEQRLHVPLSEIFIKHSFEVMTVENLTSAIMELESSH